MLFMVEEDFKIKKQKKKRNMRFSLFFRHHPLADTQKKYTQHPSTQYEICKAGANSLNGREKKNRKITYDI